MMPAFVQFARMARLLAAGSVALAIFGTTPAIAGTINDPITWGSPQSITGDSDVITTGSLVYAYNFGPVGVTSATVNGVTFEAFGISFAKELSQGSVTVSESPGWLFWGSQSSSSNPFAALSSDYKNLLGTDLKATSADTITLQLGGLTPGLVYDFQWWSNRPTSSVYVTTATAENSVTLVSNTYTPAEGGLGQYAVGTFTASDTSQFIDFSGSSILGGSSMPSINAFQLRVAAVPEPSTWVMGLAGIACAAGIALRRRTRA